MDNEEKQEQQPDQEENASFLERIEWKFFAIVVVVGVLCFLAGMFATDGSILQPASKVMTEDDCRTQYAPSYAAGVMDRVIGTMDAFIQNCTPTNPEAFSWTNLQHEKKGILLRCNNTYGDVTHLPISYSRRAG